jgi:hypothetical protein
MDIENLFNEIVPENLPNVWKDMNIHTEEIFRIQNVHDQKITSPCIITGKMPSL